MRRLLTLVLLAAVLSGCNAASTTVGVGTSGGMGVSFSAYGDFLYSGPSGAYSANRRGLLELLNHDYFAAREIFKDTLERYPGNPDTVYYLGLTLIYLDKREAGFSLLSTYNDPNKFRTTQEVRWWADYCAKKPELTPGKIHEVMNKARVQGFERDREERYERLRFGWT